MAEVPPLLEVHDLSVSYGQVHALESVSLHVNVGEIVTLAGTNGAGKSTLLRTISGLTKPRSGEISFRGERIDRLPPHKIVRAGIAHVPEGRRIFPKFNVIDNLRVGAYIQSDFRSTQDRAKARLAGVRALEDRAMQFGGSLSGGEQQLLAINRALMSDPVLLMLDEPSMGLSPVLADEMLELVQALNKKGATVVLVEQNARGALDIAHRGYVLSAGRIVMSGSAQQLLGDPEFVQAYLGTGGG